MARNLYEVTTSKFKVFTVADDVLEASDLVLRKLNEAEWGFNSERAILNIKWIATNDEYDCEDVCLLAI